MNNSTLNAKRKIEKHKAILNNLNMKASRNRKIDNTEPNSLKGMFANKNFV